MAGTTLDVNSKELAALNKRLAKWFIKISKPSEAMKLIAQHLESQTRRRIEKEKSEPDGTAWQEWSEEYAKTRHANHSLLIGTQSMLDDIASESGSDFAAVFTSMIYGRTHQEGDKSRDIPARSYLGLSKDNARAIEKEIAKFMENSI